MDINIKVEIKTPMELVHAILALAETMALVVDKQQGEGLIDKHIAEENSAEEQKKPKEIAKEESKPVVTETKTPEEIPTVVDLRAIAQEKGKTPEGKKAIKALLDEYESKSISNVPEEKRAAFFAALEGL